MYKNNIIVVYILQILGWKWMNEIELILKNNCNNCINLWYGYSRYRSKCINTLWLLLWRIEVPT